MADVSSASGSALFFLLMVVITFGYAGTLPAMMNGADFALAAKVLALHLVLQVAITNACHVTSLHRLASVTQRPKLASPMLIATAVLAGVIGWAVSVEMPMPNREGELVGRTFDSVRLFEYRPGEVGYRALLAFYGLFFPAYLLAGGRRMWPIVGLVAAPMAVAFFGGAMAWGLVGVAVVVVGGVIARRRTPAPLPPPADRSASHH